MTNEEIAMLAAAAVAGVLIGIVYFGGLWLTVQQSARIERPLLLFSVSFFARLALLLAGFYFVFSGGIARLAVCMVAFFVTRQFFIRSIQAAPERPERIGKPHGN